MHLDCFKQKNAEQFDCITSNMIDFKCECTIFTEYSIYNDYYCLDASYFNSWYDEQGSTQMKIENRYKWDGLNRNIANLSDYCIGDDEKQGIYSAAYCNTYIGEKPYTALCGCLNAKGRRVTSGFIFPAEQIYPNLTMYDEGKLISSLCKKSTQNTDTTKCPPSKNVSSEPSKNNDLFTTTKLLESSVSNYSIYIILFFILLSIICIILSMMLNKKHNKRIRYLKYHFIYSQKNEEEMFELLNEPNNHQKTVI